MKRIFLILTMLVSLASLANAADELKLYGRIYSRLTSKDEPKSFVEIMSQDSVVIASDTAYRVSYSYSFGQLKMDTIAPYSINIPHKEGIYLIRVSKPGFETKYVTYQVKDLNKREIERKVPNIYISPEREATTLDELVVQSTKIKFYNKGDTIIYDASAFQLPEGSMLDALIAQMPGVEIKDGGQIYLNGRYVESLLLNGKDFFKGNQQVMLENIGVYAVKDIAAYEKKSDLSKLFNNELSDDMEYVLDVRLKKEYRQGFMVNAEGGYGTSDRYSGRLFGLRFTDNSRLSLYANANNVNNTNRPNDGQGWDMSARYIGEGVQNIHNGGLDYLVENPQHTWELTGNFDANYTKQTQNQDNVTNNFLPEGDTYDFSYQMSKLRSLNISTEHTWKLRQKQWNLDLVASYKYSKNNNRDDNVSATFSKELQDVTRDIIKAIYSSDYKAMREALVNRNQIESRTRGNGWKGHIWSQNAYKIPGSPDGFTFWFETNYERANGSSDNKQAVDFGSIPVSSLLQQRFGNDHPQYKFMVRGSARYYLNFSHGTFSLGGFYQHDQRRMNSNLFLMEANAQDTIAVFTPDTPLLFDEINSYTSKEYENSVNIIPRFNYQLEKAPGKLYINGELTAIYSHRHLYYHRGEVNADPVRDKFYIGGGNITANWRGNNKMSVYAYYRYTERPVDLVSLVDMVNTTDPLNIQLGNPDLKNSGQHSTSLNYSYTMPGNGWLSAYIDYSWTVNSLVRGYRYDTQTGVRTYKTYNVSGNNAIYSNINYSRDIWNGISGSASFAVENYNYANMIGENADPVRQKVNNLGLAFRVGLSYRKIYYKDLKISAYANHRTRWSRSHYEQNNQTNNNERTSSTDLGLNIDLPKGFNISTEMDIMSRGGYIEEVFNNTTTIWNADLSYKLNSNWTFTIRGYDMLAQMKEVYYRVDAMGRRQTVYNTLPRYFMLSVKYTFNKKPKK